MTKILFTNSIIRKSGIDKIMLILIMELNSWDVNKSCQDSANTVSLNTVWVEKNAQNVFRLPSSTFIKLFLKLGTALLNGPAEKLSHTFSSATFYSETAFGIRWRFQNIFVHRSPNMISPGHSNLESYLVVVVRSQSLRTVLMGALLRDTCNAHRAPCILLILPLRLAAVELFNELLHQKLINSFSHCL